MVCRSDDVYTRRMFKLNANKGMVLVFENDGQSQFNGLSKEELENVKKITYMEAEFSKTDNRKADIKMKVM